MCMLMFTFPSARNVKRIERNNGVKEIISAMKLHPSVAGVQEQANAALLNLCLTRGTIFLLPNTRTA